LKDASKAKGKLRDLARQLEGLHPGAVGSILEGLEETVTVIDRRLNENLLKTLSSTSAIENVKVALARVSRNVNRWRGGLMALRWGAAGLLEAEKKLRRLKRYREMPQCIASHEAIVAKETLDAKERVAQDFNHDRRRLSTEGGTSSPKAGD
jgi:putative transposase